MERRWQLAYDDDDDLAADNDKRGVLEGELTDRTSRSKARSNDRRAHKFSEETRRETKILAE